MKLDPSLPGGFSAVFYELCVYAFYEGQKEKNSKPGCPRAQDLELLATLSLENHQDGVYLHRHGVTLSLQAILVCSNLPV